MKNRIFKKIVALSLALLMLAGTGIGATLAGVDLLQSLSIKASAENPHNDIFYDEVKGLFFEVIGGRARILGSARDAVLASPCMDEGVYTLPNKVTNSLTGIEYYVFELADYALFNFRLDVTKLIIPDNFRALTIPESSFAGWDNLTEVQWDIHNATVLGPLFEWLCEWNFEDTPTIVENDENGDTITVGIAKNVFPVRDRYGSPIFNEDGTEVLVRFYSTEIHNGFTTDYYDMFCPFDDALNHLSPQTLTNINTVSLKDITLVSSYWFEIYKEGINFDDVSVGTYDLSFTDDYKPEGGDIQVNDIDWNYASFITGTKIDSATVSIGAESDPLRSPPVYTGAGLSNHGDEVPSPSNHIHDFEGWTGKVRGNAGKPSSIIDSGDSDGNSTGSWHENVTIALHKSPVKVLTLGSNVTKVPDYLCYDLEIETINLQNVKTIGDYSFVDCNALLSIDLSNVETINVGGFASCDGLTSLDFGKVKTIGEWGFAACDGFDELTISKDITEIGGGAFNYCDSLKTVIIESGNINIGQVTASSVTDHNRTYPKPGLDFGCRPSVIAEYTPFTECKLLTTLVFGKEAFNAPSNIGYNVTTLKKVIFLADDTPVAINDNAFKNCDSLDEIEVIDPEKWPAVAIGENNDSLKFDDIVISKHQHTFETKVVPATCSSEGYTVGICLCGMENGRSNTVPKLEHTLPETPNTTVTASCDSQGYDLYICKVCGEGVRKNIQSALGHNLTNTKTYPATCTEEGKTTSVCSRCNQEIVTDTIPALGHNFGEYKYNNDATKYSDGTETAKCTRCGYSKTRSAAGTKIVDPLENAIIKSESSATVDYRTKLTVTAYGTNIPAGYRLAVFNGDKLLATGDNNSVSYYAGEITSDTNFLIRVIDSNNNILETAPKRVAKVTVNNGFFARIVAFFRGLFGMLPEKTI